MASETAGEGTSYEGAAAEGGAGGKFRKRPFRRNHATPYDRPPTALRNPRNNGWLPKLVDPAYKLICTSAQMFFSSVFRKRLPPPPPPPPPTLPEANEELRDALQASVPNNTLGKQQPAIGGDGGPMNSINGSEISELEQILKNRTFSRSQIDHLTELLHSRTVDLLTGDEKKKGESNILHPVSLFERPDEFANCTVEDDRIGTHMESPRFHGCISTSGVSSQGLEDDFASPAELAKAYMGNRTSKVSPSMLGSRSQALKEDASLPSNGPFPLKSPVTSLVSKPSLRVGVPENGFMTPRSRGRSLIYSMARTPYSRVNTTAAQKGNGSMFDGYGGPSTLSSSKHVWAHDGLHGSKPSALKRRISVLEDDIGSVGPIRRLRQKTNLLASKKLGVPVSGSPLSARRTGVGIEISQPSTSPTQNILPLDGNKSRVQRIVGENENHNIPSTSYTPVPSKSSEMATRILEQLEKLVPKEKSSEGKVVIASDKSQSKLTQNMLHGEAHRSPQEVYSSKALQNGQHSQKLEVFQNNSVPLTHGTTSQLQDNVEENGPEKSVISREMLAPPTISDITVAVKDIGTGTKTVDSVNTPFLTQPKKKHGFQISAHEELDDEMHPRQATFMPLSEGKEKLDISVVEDKTCNDSGSPASSEVKPPVVPAIGKSTDFVTSDASVADNKSTGLNLPTAPVSSSNFQPVFSHPQSSSAFGTSVPPKGHNAAPLSFRSSNENVDRVEMPPLSFSLPSHISITSGQDSGASAETKAQISNSLVNVASGDTATTIFESDNGDNRETLKSGSVMGRLDSSSSASASVSAGRLFSFGASANNSSLNNGSPSFSSSAFPTAPVFTSNPLSNSFGNAASSTTASMANDGTAVTTALDRGVSASAAAPSMATPIFNFGSTPAAASNTVSEPLRTSIAETAEVKAKTDKQITSANLSSSPFGGVSFGTASTGTSVFGSSMSASSPATNNSPKGSLFGSGNGSLVGSTQALPAGTGVASVIQSTPIEFGSSSMPSMFGSSGTASSFTSGSFTFGSSTSGSSLFGSSSSSSSLFGSSSPSPVFGSSTSFGLSSPASSSEANAVSLSGASSSLFGSSWQPSKASTSNSTFSSLSPSTGLSFGASSVSATASNAAPMVFGSSTTASSSCSIFSFTSTAASQMQPIFGSSPPVFTAPSGNGDVMNMEDSMAEDPIQASPPPAAPVFGQTPISSTPSSPFVFGSTASVPTFQFGSQQLNQSPSPFQASNSLEFNAGGNFSLGSGGPDKSNRKIVKIKRTARKR